MPSALPFWGKVWGPERRKSVPKEPRKRRGDTIYKLGPIVGLKAFNGEAKLCACIIGKINNVLVDCGLRLRGKSPTVVCEIIEKDQII